MAEITIPAAALDKAAWEIYRKSPKVITYAQAEELARAACRAMIEAWPGMVRNGKLMDEVGQVLPAIILPLTEASDDQ